MRKPRAAQGPSLRTRTRHQAGALRLGLRAAPRAGQVVTPRRRLGLHLFRCNCQFHENLERKENSKQKKKLDYLPTIYGFYRELCQRQTQCQVMRPNS